MSILVWSLWTLRVNLVILIREGATIFYNKRLIHPSSSCYHKKLSNVTFDLITAEIYEFLITLNSNLFKSKQKWILTYCPILMITSSGMVLFLSFPCFGWSPRPRNKPGGSILKLPTLCLCPSIRQKPYSSKIFSFSFFSSCFCSFVQFLLSSAFWKNSMWHPIFL